MEKAPTSYLTVGAAGGLIGGLFGGGSGVFFVPALEKMTTLPRRSLHGTAGAANIAVTGIGAATFAFVGGSVDLHAGVGMVIGGTMGAYFGARIILKVSASLLKTLFVVILLLTGSKLLLDAMGKDPLLGAALFSEQLIENLWFTGPLSLVLGFLIGAWAAGMGLGGGFLAVPVLMVLFGADLPTAEGTSLLMFFPNAVVGTLTHVRQGTADLRISGLLNLGVVPGVIVGVVIALALDVRVLSVLFAAFVLAIAVREILRARSGVSRD